MIRLFDGPDIHAPEPLLIGSLLRTPLATARDQQIVYRDQVRYTYATLEERIAKLAHALHGLGVGEGDTVAMMDWDSHRYLESYFAVPMMGAVLMTVNLRLSADQIVYCLQQSRATVLLVHHDFVSLIAGLRAQLPLLRTVVLLEPDDRDAQRLGMAAMEYESLLSRATRQYDFKEFNENAIATSFFTTGTTGMPKAVCFTHRQLVVHTLAVAAGLASAPHGQSFRHGDVYMPMTPMFHVHAWGLPYVATLLGVKQVYPGRYEPARLLALRATEGVSYSHCVPTILQMLLAAPESASTDLRGWKITVGGAALGEALARAALERGIEVFAAYGMSETCPFLTATRLMGNDPHAEAAQALQRRCRTGLPLPLVELRILDERGNDVPHDGESMGELVARAPWLSGGYANDRQASVDLWAGGHLHTGDIASMDEAGYVQIRDRSKDVIKTGGEWVSSLLLEDLLCRHREVQEAAVIAIADERWGERPCAVLVLRSGLAAADAKRELQEHLRSFVEAGLIQKYAVPESFVVVAELPKTSVGKLDKKALRVKLAGRGDRGIDIV